MPIRLKIAYLIFFILILIGNFAFAQNKPVKRDSTKLYKNIESYSKKSKFSKFMYRQIFTPIDNDSKNEEIKMKVIKPPKQKPYNSYEGKIIRNIKIVTLDPFGYSIDDTIVHSQRFLLKTGNKMHIKSQGITIRNLLLIRQGQIFDSLLVKESERLIRNNGYVHEVSFTVLPTSKNSDSVDIYIKEIDNWSITPRIIATSSRITIRLNEKNFLGFGHEYKNGLSWYSGKGDYAYNTNYYIPNIRNTYINTTLHYEIDEKGNYIKSFAIDRPFFSSFTKWAAGVNFTQQYHNDFVFQSDTLLVPQIIKFNSQNYWAGNSMQIFKGKTENVRTTNFISAIRYLRIRYVEKSIDNLTPFDIFSNEDFYLASIGISTRKYKQDKYIFKHGTTEDVPIGRVLSLVSGYQAKSQLKRYYFGARLSFGNYYTWGYMSTNFEYGTFFHKSHTEQGVFNAGINYYSRLFEIGDWKFRQFLKPQVTIGIKRFAYESISLNDGYGLDGFNSSTLTGNSRLLLTLQTQSYSTWNFIGFHFGPYFVYSIGMLGDVQSGFKTSRLYSEIGVGVLIKNENLVNSNFSFSISFFPLIPGTGQDIFKINSFKTTDFGFRNFETGPPGTMGY